MQPTLKTEVNAESISSPTPKCEESQGTTTKPTRKIYSPGVRDRPTRQPVCTYMMESYSSLTDTEAIKPVRDEVPSRPYNLFLDGESSRPSSSPTSAPIPPRVRPPRWPNMFDKTTDTTQHRPRDKATNLRVRGNIFMDEPG